MVLYVYRYNVENKSSRSKRAQPQSSIATIYQYNIWLPYNIYIYIMLLSNNVPIDKLLICYNNMLYDACGWPPCA